MKEEKMNNILEEVYEIFQPCSQNESGYENGCLFWKREKLRALHIYTE